MLPIVLPFHSGYLAQNQNGIACHWKWLVLEMQSIYAAPESPIELYHWWIRAYHWSFYKTMHSYHLYTLLDS